MAKTEQLLTTDQPADPLSEYVSKFTGDYINGLEVLPDDRSLLFSSTYPGLARFLRIKDAKERILSEKKKFHKRFTTVLEEQKKYILPKNPKLAAVGTRIIAVIAGTDLISAANNTFDIVPALRNPLISSAREVFLYGAEVSKACGEEIDPVWLNGFMLNVVMQSVEAWQGGGKEAFSKKVAQFREPPLMS